MKKEKENIENITDQDNKNVLSDEAPVTKKEKASKTVKIGAMLKEMRQQQALKIIDVSKKLCIRKCYLEAIEESNYTEIPPFPYGIGFIRSYANFLGLNGDDIVELYKAETTSCEQRNIDMLGPQPEATMPNVIHIIVSLLAIGLIYAGWVMYNQQTEKTTIDDDKFSYAAENNDTDYADVIVVKNYNQPNNEEGTNTDEPVKDSTPEDQIFISEEPYQETENGDIQDNVEANDVQKTIDDTKSKILDDGIYIEVLKTTWVEVKDINRLYLSKVLQPGEVYKIPAGEGKILSVGKYDGVNVYINGILTEVVRPQKKMNIYLDKFINSEL